MSTRRHIYNTGSFGPAIAKERPAIIHAPLSHVGGFYRLIDNIIDARPILLMRKFEPLEWSELVEKYHIKVDGLNATTLRMVLDENLPASRLSSLRAVRCGMAAISEELRAEFEGRFGVPILRAYGATEFSGEVAGWTLSDYKQLSQMKIGSVGRIYDSIDARIVNDNHKAIEEPGQIGLLELRGQRIGDGTSWVTTNDLAAIDKDRFLWIHGRADDAISRGGFKVVPEEVRKVICSHPGVREAAIVGIPDPRLGHVIGAAVTLRSNSDSSSNEILHWCSDRMPRYMIPARITILAELPRLRSMKVDRGAILALLESER